MLVTVMASQSMHGVCCTAVPAACTQVLEREQALASVQQHVQAVQEALGAQLQASEDRLRAKSMQVGTGGQG